MRINLRAHIRLAVFYFFLVALLGSVLRWFVHIDFPAEYRYLVHTHSHIALLGWVYVALSSLLYFLFLKKKAVTTYYRRLFWFTQITIIGMLVTFPLQGYAFFSILFSTLFLISSYFFSWLLLTKTAPDTKKRFSFTLAKAAVWLLVFSSIGPWALGGIMTTLGSTSVWYKLAIYFYLHFQYNGWFIVALLAVLFYFLEQARCVPLQQREQSRFFIFLISSVLLTFFLSVLWTNPHELVYGAAAAGAIIQTGVFLFLFFRLVRIWPEFKNTLKPGVRILLYWSGILLALKLDLQLLSALPYVADLAYHTPDFVIGYMHLVFLGVISPALFAWLLQLGLLRVSLLARRLYFIAFICTESLLFYKGTAIWLGLPLPQSYYSVLGLTSLLFPVALGMLFFYQKPTKPYSKSAVR